jgi:hypothetical protein
MIQDAGEGDHVVHCVISCAKEMQDNATVTGCVWEIEVGIKQFRTRHINLTDYKVLLIFYLKHFCHLPCSNMVIVKLGFVLRLTVVQCISPLCGILEHDNFLIV